MKFRKEISIFNYVYRASFLVTFLLLAIISALIALMVGYTIFEEQNGKLNGELSDLREISLRTEMQAQMIKSLLKSYYQKDGVHTSADSNERIMRSVLQSTPNIFGVGYAENTKYGNFGIYMSHRNQSLKIDKYNMSEYYKNKNTRYDQRPWYKDVLFDHKEHVYTPQINWFSNDGGYTLTESYPFFLNGSISAVGTVDIDLSNFFSRLDPTYNKYYDILFKIGGYRGSTLKPGFYRFRPPNKFIYTLPLYSYDNISVLWKIKSFFLYKKVTYLNGGLEFLIKVDLKPFFLGVIILSMLLAMIIVSVLLFTRKKLKKKIDEFVSPIISLSSNLENIVTHSRIQNAVGNDIDIEKVGIKEINVLYNSIEKLRTKVKEHVSVERSLASKQTQLDIASEIQDRFLLKDFDSKFFKKLGFDIACIYMKASDLSGDVFDIGMQGDFLYIFIGDASGKNASACIFSLFVLSRYRILSKELYEPCEILSHINNYLCEISTEKMFLSAICLRINIHNGDVIIANAGHDSPIVFNRKGVSVDIFSGDMVLGVLENVVYRQANLDMSDIQSIFVYTDGLSEAQDGELFFGKERIIQELRSKKHETSQISLSDLVSEINIFEKESCIKDDKTAILIGSVKTGVPLT